MHKMDILINMCTYKWKMKWKNIINSWLTNKYKHNQPILQWNNLCKWIVYNRSKMKEEYKNAYIYNMIELMIKRWMSTMNYINKH